MVRRIWEDFLYSLHLFGVYPILFNCFLETSRTRAILDTEFLIIIAIIMGNREGIFTNFEVKWPEA